MSLRARVTVLAAACVAGAVALVSFGAFLTVQGNLYSDVDENLIARAHAAAAVPPVLVEWEQIPGAFLTSTDLQVGVLSAQSRVVQFPQDGRPPPTGRDELAVAVGAQPLSIRTDDRSDARVVAVPFPGRPGSAMVIAQSLRPTKNTLAELAVVLALIGGAGIVVAAVAGTAVARGGLGPVQRLTEATERVARTNDLRPIPVSGDDELARLTLSFNTMLGAVAQSQEMQRQLVADAGHELRTPLTSLRTNLELLLSAESSTAPTLSAQDRAEIEADIRAQLDELTQLIGDLVELSSQDEPDGELEVVDLLDVVERALDRARRRAGDLSFDVALQPWSLRGEPAALERAVLNLLDNAVKFSPPGGTVRVALRQRGDGTAVVEVADSGPGIAAEDLPRVFDRFYRSLQARTLPGSGLGLAIVSRTAHRHGGSVQAGASADGGALLSLTLPGAVG